MFNEMLVNAEEILTTIRSYLLLIIYYLIKYLLGIKLSFRGSHLDDASCRCNLF